ncbi:MAG: alpha/beta hydrolase [Candidatus Cryptobacteroides sp.]
MSKSTLIAIAACLAFCQTAVFAQDLLVVSSENLRCDDSVLVFSPKIGGEPQRSLPTLFLLHGWGGCFRDWSRNTDLQELSDDYGFRIICPDGFKDSWYLDKVDSTGMKWRSFFWEELWPLVDSEYGLDSGRTFIDGLSMGGHGAMNIFLDRPDLFRGAGSMSGVLNLRHSGGSRVLIPQMLGAEDIEDPLCDAQSALNRLERVAQACGDVPGSGAGGKLLLVSCGTLDKTFLPASEEFAARCRELSLTCIETYSPARHRWPYWVWVLPQHLHWFKESLTGSEMGFTAK